MCRNMTRRCQSISIKGTYHVMLSVSCYQDTERPHHGIAHLLHLIHKVITWRALHSVVLHPVDLLHGMWLRNQLDVKGFDWVSILIYSRSEFVFWVCFFMFFFSFFQFFPRGFVDLRHGAWRHVLRDCVVARQLLTRWHVEPRPQPQWSAKTPKRTWQCACWENSASARCARCPTDLARNLHFLWSKVMQEAKSPSFNFE